MLRSFESSCQSGAIPMVFKEEIKKNLESKFELQNSGPSEIGFERLTLYIIEGDFSSVHYVT